MSIKCGNCKLTHDTADQVRNCYGVPVRHTQQTQAQFEGFAAQRAAVVQAEAQPVAATEKQVAFIRSLCEDRDVPVAGRTPEEAVLVARCEDVVGGGKFVSKREASAVITWLLDQPKVKVATTKRASGNQPTEYMAKAERGHVHVVDGVYYRIHIGQHTGNPYAAKAVIIAEAKWDGAKLVKAGRVRWERCKGFIYQLTEATMATAEEAHAFGVMVGRCCFCSHEIDTPESVQAGYGPVCAAKYGLPWG